MWEAPKFQLSCNCALSDLEGSGWSARDDSSPMLEQVLWQLACPQCQGRLTGQLLAPRGLLGPSSFKILLMSSWEYYTWLRNGSFRQG